MRHLMTTAAWTCLAAVLAGPAMAAEAAADTGTTLEEVVVTATKSETNLQKTPIAISVMTAAAMVDRHAGSLISLQDGAIPSLRVATFEARQSALVIGIRGIVPFDANQTARDQGVGKVAPRPGVGIDLLLQQHHGVQIGRLHGPQGHFLGWV